MKRPLDWGYLKSIKRIYFVYGGILIGFILWMLFIDTHSWTIHSELNQEIEQLELEKDALKIIIEKDQKTINDFLCELPEGSHQVLEHQDLERRFRGFQRNC